MDTRDYSSENEQQKQTLRFTIEYNEDNPIAVSEFTKALDSLNQLYMSFVCQKIHSKEINISEEDINESTIGQFYIKEINKGSILCLLTGIGIIDIIGLVGSIASIVSCAMYFWDKRHTKKDKDQNDGLLLYDLTKNLTVNDLNLLEELIQPIKEGKTISIEVEGKKIVIDYSQKQKIKEVLYHIKTHYSQSYSSFRREWVQIENINNKYYATIIYNPLIKSIKLPVELRLRGEDERVILNIWRECFYYVNIKLNRSYNNNGQMEYIISRIYDYEPMITTVCQSFK